MSVDVHETELVEVWMTVEYDLNHVPLQLWIAYPLKVSESFEFREGTTEDPFEDNNVTPEYAVVPISAMNSRNVKSSVSPSS